MRPNLDLRLPRKEVAADTKAVQDVEHSAVDLVAAWEQVEPVLVVAKSTCQTFVIPRAVH